MATVTMPQPTKIQSAMVQSTPDTIRLQFGGGYSQRVARGGFNNIKETLQINWINLTKSEMQAIHTALTANNGLNLFSYTTDNGTALKYWSVQDSSSGEVRDGWRGTARLWNYSASFNREYDNP